MRFRKREIVEALIFRWGANGPSSEIFARASLLAVGKWAATREFTSYESLPRPGDAHPVFHELKAIEPFEKIVEHPPWWRFWRKPARYYRATYVLAG